MVENIDVHGFEHAIRAARNPMNSWAKTDSNGDMIGTADMDLLKRLTKAGVPHRTFLRMIVVWMDITAPLYWWKEADRYTVGKAQVSTSTGWNDAMNYIFRDGEGYRPFRRDEKYEG